jgi:hypothetical protein
LEALKRTKNTQQQQELQEHGSAGEGSGFECDPGSQKKTKNTQQHQEHASAADGLTRI